MILNYLINATQDKSGITREILAITIGLTIAVFFSGCSNNAIRPTSASCNSVPGLAGVPSCTIKENECDPDIKTIRYEPKINTVEPKSIFVFMDGTSNTEEIPTNVYRLFEKLLTEFDDKKTVAIYIQGVGNASSPIEEDLGAAFGFGMEKRILEAYRFIMQHYRPKDNAYPGDRIYIFGFSRGAFTARNLAGLISYAGVPIGEESDLNNKKWNNATTSCFNFGNKILEEVRKVTDIQHILGWQDWRRGNDPILKDKLIDKVKTDLGRKLITKVQPAEIEFLGVWDTVPGSTGKDYFNDYRNLLVCKEDRTATDSKQRYQLDSYPPILHIAHAVAQDEKREKFSPLFLCSKELNKNSVHNEKTTILDEVVFPGAHADVGGGYGHKNNQLPDISLKWMAGQLYSHYQSPLLKSYIDSDSLIPNPEGLASLSVSKNMPGNIPFKCRDRQFPDKAITKTDPSINVRNDAGPVPWVYFDKRPNGLASDQSCKNKVNPSTWKEDKTDGSKPEDIVCIEQSNLTCEALGYKQE